jgi:hypothetical protein
MLPISPGTAAKIGETYYESYEAMVRRALMSGSLVIAAAGNESRRKRGRNQAREPSG